MALKRWSAAEARRRFAKLIEASVHEPQGIYRHDRLVAGVVDARNLEAFREWKDQQSGGTLADAMTHLAKACAEEHYSLAFPRRRNRQNRFAPKTRR